MSFWGFQPVPDTNKKKKKKTAFFAFFKYICPK